MITADTPASTARDANTLRITLELPLNLAQTAASSLSAPAAVPHENPLHFATVDRVRMVGASSPEAERIARKILSQFLGKDDRDIASTLTPYAETLVSAIETAHKAIEGARKVGAQAVIPSPTVQVNSCCTCAPTLAV